MIFSVFFIELTLNFFSGWIIKFTGNEMDLSSILLHKWILCSCIWLSAFSIKLLIFVFSWFFCSVISSVLNQTWLKKSSHSILFLGSLINNLVIKSLQGLVIIDSIGKINWKSLICWGKWYKVLALIGNLPVTNSNKMIPKDHKSALIV